MTQKAHKCKFVGTQIGKKCCICGETRSVKYRFQSGEYLCNMCQLRRSIRLNEKTHPYDLEDKLE